MILNIGSIKFYDGFVYHKRNGAKKHFFKNNINAIFIELKNNNYREKYKYPAINNNAVSKPAMIVRMFPIGFFVDMLYIQNALPKKKNNPAIIAVIILGVVIINFVFIISFSGIIFKNVNINNDDTPNVKQKNNHVDI